MADTDNPSPGSLPIRQAPPVNAVAGHNSGAGATPYGRWNPLLTNDCTFPSCNHTRAPNASLCFGHLKQKQKGKDLKPLRHKAKNGFGPKPLNRQKPTPSERFFAMVEKTDTCWIWVGYTMSNGYGTFGLNGKKILAHRFSYIIAKGPIPDGLTIDHLCRVRNCVNPSHLEAVTMRENLLRGNTLTAKEAAQTHCLRGHAFDGNNLIKLKNGKRGCRSCKKIYNNSYKVPHGN